MIQPITFKRTQHIILFFVVVCSSSNSGSIEIITQSNDVLVTTILVTEVS